MRDDWVEVELKDIFQIVTGNTPSKKDPANYGGEIPFVKPPSLWNGTVGVTQEFLTENGTSKSRLLPPFSTLVTCIGNLGRVGINRQKVAFNQQINAIKPLKNIDSYFTFYQAQSPNFKLQLENKSSATTVAIVNKGNFGTIKYKLIPLPEQRAIVAKIEELFSSLDNGISDLNKASAQLKIYRQAVLKKAFTGELTKEWRAKQASLPTAHELLQQIQTERQNHHQQLLTKWQETVQLWQDGEKEGKKPAKPRSSKDALPLGKDELKLLDNVPNIWLKTRLENISLIITDGDHQAPPKSNKGIPFITISNIKNNKIDFSNTFFVDNIYYNSLIQYRVPKQGDVLYTVTGSYGIPVLINFDKQFCFQRHIGLIRPLSSTNSKWLFWLLQSRFIYNQATVKATGTAQKTIGLASIRSFATPICSLPEQLQIVQEIESRLSVCDNIEQSISTSLKKAEGLRQSILKKAFAGELLSSTALEACRNDPDWQPASELLKQIKAEKKMRNIKTSGRSIPATVREFRTVQMKYKTEIDSTIAKSATVQAENT